MTTPTPWASLIFLSTLSLRRATGGCVFFCTPCHISIHALLAESDHPYTKRTCLWLISIHALLAESDRHSLGNSLKCFNFYPRSPCGERLPRYRKRALAQSISIHALLAESDGIYGRRICSGKLFLSTLSLRRATSERSEITCRLVYFYPRSPCGERLTSVLPTIPAPAISIHALLAESDRKSQSSGAGIRISIHALLAESDVGQKRLRQKLAISIHALLAESDAFDLRKRREK